MPLTTYSNGISKPSFSPDGNQVAYSWEGENQDGVDIYIKQIGSEKPLRLTADFGRNFFPAWSPDGRYIAFSHSGGVQRSGIYLVPALGGPPRKLIELPNAKICMSVPSWSPDGKLLTFSDLSSSTSSCSVNQINLEDLKVRQLTWPRSASTGDRSAAYSPDGETLAFLRNTKEVDDIYLMPASGGEPRRLTFDNRLIIGLTWTPDSKELIFASSRGGAGLGLWRISARGGTPERVPVGSDHAFAPVISLKGHRLIYASGLWNQSIWRIPIAPGHRTGKPEKLIFSAEEQGPQYSPDGSHIAFQSTRSGNFEIWRANADGSNLVQLTSFGGPLTGTPRWSPDGKQICFDTRPGPHANIDVISADGGPPRPFLNDTADDVVPSWSHDGRSLYFASNRSGAWQVWKRTVDGGQPVQITKKGGFAALESPDGNSLYYAKFNEPGLWKVPVAGGEEAKVLDEPPERYWGYFVIGGGGIYYLGDIAVSGKHKPGFKSFNFATRKITVIGETEKDPDRGAPGMSVSPDGRFILYVQLDDIGYNLILAENFH